MSGQKKKSDCEYSIYFFLVSSSLKPIEIFVPSDFTVNETPLLYSPFFLDFSFQLGNKKKVSKYLHK